MAFKRPKAAPVSGVLSVTAADGSITIGGTAANPTVAAAVKARQQIQAEAMGFLSMPFGRDDINGNQPASTGVLQGVLLGFKKGDTVRGVSFFVAGGPSGLTLAKAGLRNPTTQGLLASTPDKSATFNGSGALRWESGFLFSVPYVVPADIALYVEVLFVGTTPPTIQRGPVANATVNGAVNGGFRPVAQQAGQTDLPVTAVYGDTINYYFICAVGTAAVT